MNLQFDQASFRDPSGRVFFHDGEVYRTLSADSISVMQALLKSNAYQELERRGLIVSAVLEDFPLEGKKMPVLHHKRIPVITYPYEWTFEMLKDAALAQLEINELLIPEGFILKDGSGFNSCYDHGRMCFIDTLSIDKNTGVVWEGYSQFCQHFLFPLLISAYKKMPINFLWRNTMKGIPLDVARQFFSFKDFFKAGVFKHIVLQKKLADSLGSEVKGNSAASKVCSQNGSVQLALTKGLKKLIEGLANHYSQSTWSDYEESHSYSSEDHRIKHSFIEKHLKSRSLKRVVDLGANRGEYSKIASQYADEVIALDFDEMCVDRLYRDIRESSQASFRKIVPMTGDLMQLSPDQGWHLNERSNQISRIQSDCFMALALMHHLCIAENVSLESFALLLKKVAPRGIVEWVSLEDDMVKFMLRNRKNIFKDYTWDNFKNALEKYGKVTDVVETHEGKRKLCFVEFSG